MKKGLNPIILSLITVTILTINLSFAAAEYELSGGPSMSNTPIRERKFSKKYT